jgi:DNA-directed RNA polymerase specialized sigma24 family protein
MSPRVGGRRSAGFTLQKTAEGKMGRKIPDSLHDGAPEKSRLSKEELGRLRRRAGAGDREAFGSLCEAYRKVITGRLTTRTGNPWTADEICQQTFEKLYMMFIKGTFDPTRAFYKYVSKTAHSVMNDHLQRQGKGPIGSQIQRASGDGENILDRVPDNGPSPEESVIQSDLERSLSLDLLESRHRCRLELLRNLPVCCAKPHQITAFGYAKLLSIKPREVSGATISGRTLGHLTVDFFHSYLSTFDGKMSDELCSLLSEEFKSMMESYRMTKLEKKTEEIYPEDEYNRIRQDFPDTKVAGLRLQEFYTRDREACISDWCYKVKNRARNLIREGILCESKCAPSDAGGKNSTGSPSTWSI